MEFLVECCGKCREVVVAEVTDLVEEIKLKFRISNSLEVEIAAYSEKWKSYLDVEDVSTLVSGDRLQVKVITNVQLEHSK